MRHLRALLIAVATLAVSAGVALAGHALPQAATNGLGVASEAAGMQVPVRADQAEPDQTTPDESTTDESATDAPDAAPTEDAAAQGEHGALVSEAAQGETPDGWANHGAYVSAVARGLAQPGDVAPEGSNGRVKNQAPEAPAPAKGKSAGHRPTH